MSIASNTSSMPEIAGGLIDYFSPYSPEECLQKITLYTDDQERKKKEKAIRASYKSTDWKHTYNQILSYMSHSND